MKGKSAAPGGSRKRHIKCPPDHVKFCQRRPPLLENVSHTHTHIHITSTSIDHEIPRTNDPLCIRLALATILSRTSTSSDTPFLDSPSTLHDISTTIRFALHCTARLLTLHYTFYGTWSGAYRDREWHAPRLVRGGPCWRTARVHLAVDRVVCTELLSYVFVPL
jgi:hypothetical protein